MASVSIRDLRNHGGDVVDRVAAGERVTITRGGRPVAELRPLTSLGLQAEALLERWKKMPVVDPERLRADLDETLQSSV